MKFSKFFPWAAVYSNEPYFMMYSNNRVNEPFFNAVTSLPLTGWVVFFIQSFFLFKFPRRGHIFFFHSSVVFFHHP